MLRDLEAYYASKGILSTKFTCRHRDACGQDCPAFTGPKSAFVSSGYARGVDVPRLLFLSLDSGSAEKDDLKRSPSDVREQEEVHCDFTYLQRYKNRHWYRTHELAWHILRRFSSSIEMKDTCQYFAHANSAKCCRNNPHRAQAKPILFDNCREFLGGELQVLRPDVVVTQGERAREAIQSLARDRVAVEEDEHASLIDLEGRRIFWLPTPHPNRRGPFYAMRRGPGAKSGAGGWLRYAALIERFIQSGSDWSPPRSVDKL